MRPFDCDVTGWQIRVSQAPTFLGDPRVLNKDMNMLLKSCMDISAVCSFSGDGARKSPRLHPCISGRGAIIMLSQPVAIGSSVPQRKIQLGVIAVAQ